jgi:integrase
MKVKKRGKFYHYRFEIDGQEIRESAKATNRQLAEEAMRNRRHELERGINRLGKREKMPLFRIAAQEWLDSRVGLVAGTLDRYKHQVALLKGEFGGRLVCDITADDVKELQRKRQTEGRAPRTINYEIMTLGMILRTRGLWAPIGERIKSLRQRPPVGRAVSKEDEAKLLATVGQSDSPALLPLFVLGMDTGLRASELRALRHKDLELTWDSGAIVSGRLIVPKSKTEAGVGRTVPLTRRVCAVLTLWLSRFADATPLSFAFPRHRIACRGGKLEHHLYDVDLAKPIGSWKRAWRHACVKEAKLSYRWHDLRHTFVSRLAENPAVSEETIRALAGHVSNQMLQRYSHIRNHAKVAAIATLQGDVSAPETPETAPASAQKSAHPSPEELN